MLALDRDNLEFAIRVLVVWLFFGLAACSEPPPNPDMQAAAFDYGAHAATWPRCPAQESAAHASPARTMQTPGGIRFKIVPPANYQPEIQHPLLVVFAPGGHSETAAERFYGLTRDATARGFIVAFAADRPPTMETLLDLAQVPKMAAAAWCVDAHRIFATGHSNGGLVTNAMGFLPETQGSMAAIAPSAAGIRDQDLEEFQCPVPTSALIFHGRKDTLFPDWGRGVAQWWATCNQCAPGPTPLEGGQCQQFPACASGVETIYCEDDWTHRTWPGAHDRMLDFFERHARAGD